MKNIRFFFLSENFPFLVGKCSIYLNRSVFVMTTAVSDQGIHCKTVCHIPVSLDTSRGSKRTVQTVGQIW